MIFPTITLPPIQEVVPNVDLDAITDDQDRAWNAHCTALVEAFAAEHGTIRTHYPFDAEDGSTDDTVALDTEGRIIILDGGAA